MKHKKVLASILALASLTALTPLTAFAADPTVIDQTTEDKTGNTEVSYDVAAAYTVTIPAAVTLGDTEQTAEISAENVLLEKGKTVKVTLSQASNTTTENATTFNAKCGDSTATYGITAGGTAVALGGTIATFETKAEQQNVELKFSAPTGATYAGKHTENLTFTIAVADAAPAAEMHQLTLSGEYFDDDRLTDVPYSLDIEYTENDTWADMVNKYDALDTWDYGPAPGGKVIHIVGHYSDLQVKSSESTYIYGLVSMTDKVSDYSAGSYYLGR